MFGLLLALHLVSIFSVLKNCIQVSSVNQFVVYKRSVKQQTDCIHLSESDNANGFGFSRRRLSQVMALICNIYDIDVINRKNKWIFQIILDIVYFN